MFYHSTWFSLYCTYIPWNNLKTNLLAMNVAINRVNSPIRVKVFKNGPSKICGRQPLKNWSDMVTSNFLKAVFHKFYSVHSWIPWSIYSYKCIKNSRNSHRSFFFTAESPLRCYLVKSYPNLITSLKATIQIIFTHCGRNSPYGHIPV